MHPAAKKLHALDAALVKCVRSLIELDAKNHAAAEEILRFAGHLDTEASDLALVFDPSDINVAEHIGRAVRDHTRLRDKLIAELVRT